MIIYSISNSLLDKFFARGSADAGIPTSYECWLGMSTTVPKVDDTSGSQTYGKIINFTEPAPSTGYRRSRLGIRGNESTYIMDEAKKGTITNGENFIFFDEAKVGAGGFGELKWFGLFSKSSESPNAELVLAGELTSPVTVPAGNVLIFRPKNLTVTME